MNDDALWLLVQLVRATLWLSLCAVAAAAVLRWARVSSPALHRAACGAALLAGCFFVQLPLDVPWYPAEPLEAAVEPDQVQPADALLADSEWAQLPPLPVSAIVPTEGAQASAAPVLVAPPAEAPPVAPDSPAWRPSWQLVVAGGWLAGMLVLAAVWLGGYLAFVWRLPRGSQADPAWESEWQALLADEGQRSIPLRVTEHTGPLLCCLPRGYELVVPAPLWRALGAAERGAILRHELAHLRRHDVWKSLGVHLLALPHWFNPLAWWTVRRFDEAAEWACDRSAAREPAAYAAILVRLGELANTPIRFSSAMSRRPLAARIRRLVAPAQREDTTMKRLLVIVPVACLLAAALVRVQLVAQEAKPVGEETPGASEQGPVDPDSVTDPVDPANDQFSDDPQSKAEEKSRESNSVGDLFSDAPLEPAAESAPKRKKPLRGQSPPLLKPRPAPADATPPAVLAAKKKMVEAAKRSFETNWAGWDSGTATFDYVTFWSERWLAAELDLAGNRAEQLAAAKAHLQRMQQFHQKVAALFKSGSRGGEANIMAAADYYVADAERKLAEIEASAVQREIRYLQSRFVPGVGVVQEEHVKIVPADALPTTPPSDAPATTTPRTYGASEPVPATEPVSVVPAPAAVPAGPGWPSTPRAPFGQPGQPGQPADPGSLPTRTALPTAPQATTSAPAVRPTTPKPPTYAPTPDKPLPGAPYGYVPDGNAPAGSAAGPQTYNIPATKPVYPGPAPYNPQTTVPPPARERVYKNRTFTQWREQFEFELDFDSRTEALEALRQFAANGYGEEVATAILKATGGYSLRELSLRNDADKEQVADLLEAALLALRSGPAEEIRPILAKFIKEGRTNERVFAVHGIPENDSQALPLLIEAAHDADAEVRALACQKACEIDTPAFVRSLQAALDGTARDERLWAIGIVPHLVEFKVDVSAHGLDKKLVTFLGDNDAEVSEAASAALVKLGTAAVPALKDAEASDDADAAKRARKLRESIEKKQAEFFIGPKR